MADQVIQGTDPGPLPQQPVPVPGQDGFGGVHITLHPPQP